eukprot:scaffold9406_cov149-Isochrysis_galbana.AAC.3
MQRDAPKHNHTSTQARRLLVCRYTPQQTLHGPPSTSAHADRRCGGGAHPIRVAYTNSRPSIKSS